MTRLKSSKGFWVLVSYFGISVLGVLYSQDLNYALNDLRIKLPLLLIPFFVASQPGFSSKELRILLLFFLFGLLVSTGFTYYNLNLLRLDGIADVRYASVFISHIRLSLMLVLGMVICWFYGFFKTKNVALRILLLLFSIWLVYFTIQMQMLTGLVVLLVSILVSVQWALSRMNNKVLKLTGMAIVFSVFGAGIFMVFKASESFMSPKENQLLVKTVEGHRYFHDSENFQLENGNRVWDNICEMELKTAWNKRSTIGYNEQGTSGQFIRETLIRYLTSKGLPKDAASVAKLNDDEVLAVEQGATNFKFIKGRGLEKRIYETVWELHNYWFNHDNPSGNSVAQRLEFWNVGFHVFKHNWLVGVGTGDLIIEMEKAYDKTGSLLSSDYRLKPHNQYLTSMICFGIFGLIQLIGLFIWAFIRTRFNVLSIVFLSIAVVSMLTEDTLETQVGATFVALFLSLFVLGHPEPIEPQELSQKLVDN
ncbi:MAG: O-antigen ligase family protein [Salibacteraceae bacterium]